MNQQKEKTSYKNVIIFSLTLLQIQKNAAFENKKQRILRIRLLLSDI